MRRTDAARQPELLDLAPPAPDLLAEVVAGLAAPRKSLPCKLFYDEAGARLFERICELPEYYPTRTELGILADRGAEIAAAVGPGAALIELGSGSGSKTRRLLERLERPDLYVPIDISREQLVRSARELDRAFPTLRVLPICADYTRDVQLPRDVREHARRAVFFPGSTIGNFLRPEAVAFLRRIARMVGPGGGLLVGVDLAKDRAVLEAAYDDAQGVTAAFNRNALAHLNRALGADFDLDAFAHRAFYDERRGRIEMHLVATRVQTVRVGGRTFAFAAGETIHTESSCKYSVEEFQALAERAGFTPRTVWTDAGALFSVHWLIAR